MKSIFYRDGYCFILSSPFQIETDIRLGERVETDYAALEIDGLLTIKPGFPSDGPSGPTVPTRDFIRGAFTHDCLYALMRGGYIDHLLWRETADKLLRTMCIEDGMPHFRAEYVYQAVRNFAFAAADPSIDHPVLQAPVDE